MVAELAAGPDLLERSFASRLRLWQQSMAQARRTVEQPDDFGSRTRTRLAALRTPKRPVFVLGSPRSGTTYLGELLSAIPDATYFFEPQILKYYVRLVYEGRVSSQHARWVYREGLRSLLLAAPGGGARAIEKNPNQVFVASQIAEMFPDVRFVVITRDGRDVSLSLSEKPWHRVDGLETGSREPGGYRFGPAPHFYIEPDRREEFRATSDLHRCIWIWRRHQEAVEALPDVLDQHQVHRLRYEDLVGSPETTLPGMLDFLEVTTPGRQAVFRRAATGRASSVGRWRKAFGPEDLATIEGEAGALLRSLGYD